MTPAILHQTLVLTTRILRYKQTRINSTLRKLFAKFGSDLQHHALSMIKSYLTDRKQKCQLGDVITCESRVACDIPQGSILGPLLFLLYINDLPDWLRQVSPRLFADYTSLTAAGETIEEVESAMNNDLLRIKEWLLVNKLSLNVAKTEFLLIGSHHKLNNLDFQPSIKIGCDCIKQVRHSRVLGVEIDEHLQYLGTNTLKI